MTNVDAILQANQELGQVPQLPSAIDTLREKLLAFETSLQSSDVGRIYAEMGAVLLATRLLAAMFQQDTGLSPEAAEDSAAQKVLSRLDLIRDRVRQGKNLHSATREAMAKYP